MASERKELALPPPLPSPPLGEIDLRSGEETAKSNGNPSAIPRLRLPGHLLSPPPLTTRINQEEEPEPLITVRKYSG